MQCLPPEPGPTPSAARTIAPPGGGPPDPPLPRYLRGNQTRDRVPFDRRTGVVTRWRTRPPGLGAQRVLREEDFFFFFLRGSTRVVGRLFLQPL